MRLPPKDEITAVKVVHIFAPIPIAIEAGKPMTPVLNAARVIIHIAPLDLIITVAISPKRPNPHRLRFLYASKFS